MADVIIKGEEHFGVTTVRLPKIGGGKAKFFDTSLADATASDVRIGKTAFGASGLFTGTLKNEVQFGTIRTDAELIKTFTHDSLAVTDDEVTIPAYSTSAQTLIAAASLSPTISLDYENYNYFVLERLLTIPVYNTSTPVKGRNEYGYCTACYELMDIPANSYHSLAGSKVYTSRSVGTMTYSSYRLLYFSSATALGVYTASSYGVAQVLSAPSVSSGTWTIKAPALQMRGHSSYLPSAVWGTITDIRRQYVIEVYRAPKGNLNLDGWGLNQQALSIINDVNNNNKNLR